jgi:hypothetical protein
VWVLFAVAFLPVGFFLLPLLVFVLATTIALVAYGPGLLLARAAAVLAFLVAGILVALTAISPGQREILLLEAGLAAAVGVFTLAAGRTARVTFTNAD